MIAAMGHAGGCSATASRGWLGCDGDGRSGRTNPTIWCSRPRCWCLGSWCRRVATTTTAKTRSGSVKTPSGRACWSPTTWVPTSTSSRLSTAHRPHPRRSSPSSTTPPSVYPGFDVLEQFAQAECLASFEPYVGVGAFDSKLFYSWFVPTLDGWNDADDREVLCVLGRQDAALMTGSIRSRTSDSDDGFDPRVQHLTQIAGTPESRCSERSRSAGVVCSVRRSP